MITISSTELAWQRDKLFLTINIEYNIFNNCVAETLWSVKTSGPLNLFQLTALITGHF